MRQVTVFRIVKQHVDAYDYDALLAQGAPEDEFDDISRRITAGLTPGMSVPEIAVLMAGVIKADFGDPVNPGDFMQAAGKLHQALHTAGFAR